jgi:3'(2'), 5'-bisphosphate nucleotidase / inositol polyphosphate 1-phosphatase
MGCTGAQALVAWSLQRSVGEAGFSMVAEEDSEDLRGEGGAAMTKRITQLVNQTLKAEADGGPLTEEDILKLIDAGGSPGGSVVCTPLGNAYLQARGLC